MNLDEAIELAALAHRGQVDKRGEPYILHALRVMQASGPDKDHMIVAVLHDTLEDTHVTEELLLERGLAVHLVEAIYVLTRQDQESYRDFISRCAWNQIARRIKIKDLEDNMSPDRNPAPVDRTSSQRLLKYRRAHLYLYSTIFDEVRGLPHGTTFQKEHASASKEAL